MKLPPLYDDRRKKFDGWYEVLQRGHSIKTAVATLEFVITFLIKVESEFAPILPRPMCNYVINILTFV